MKKSLTVAGLNGYIVIRITIISVKETWNEQKVTRIEHLETKANLLNGRIQVLNIGVILKNIYSSICTKKVLECIVLIVKYGDGSVMLWGYFST